MKETNYPTNKPTEIKVHAIHDGICERCLSTDVNHLLDSYGEVYCTSCEHYGRLYEFNYLYRHNRTVKPTIHMLRFSFELSEAQKRGSNFFLQCIDENKNGFLEAVCGAGKTEMLYEGILKLLNSQMRICLAIPRKQVVIELSNRLQGVFPSTIIKPLYDELKDDQNAHIIISTIHQLIHYYHEFDAIILDEVDAFPLEGNPFLEQLIYKAIKRDALIFMMSATISKNRQIDIKKMNMNTCLIASRFHEQPLDIPQTLHILNMTRDLYLGKINNKIIKTLRLWRLQEHFVFIYVPTIKIGTLIYEILKTVLNNVCFLSSKTRFKNVILSDFSKKRVDYLITTSILERGVTYPNLNVMVLFADHLIYSKEMLIQISGRVGRKKSHPHGEILFVSEYLSKEMTNAILSIKSMNLLHQQSVQ
ncbi:MAG: helicase-related protein [Candidatus Izemoplasmatales bacterium]|jgi:competence protein ComFA|nr:helicase-related protein [Candidatus Izemoplasmatales bacterium]